MESFQKKVFVIYYWLLQNTIAQNQGGKINRGSLKDTAYHYVETFKDNIHNATYKYFKMDKYIETEFYIRICRPKFRGSVNYRLDSHSLYFNSSNPSLIRIFLSGDEEIKCWKDVSWNSNKTQVHVASDWWIDRFRKIAVHPHISLHGEPCLGNWSQAWSTCIATNNLVSLVNVAKGFLNTWTSYDAFWNINNVRRTWLRLPREIRRYYLLKDYIFVKQLWVDIAQHLNRSTRNLEGHNFIEWVNDNIGEVMAYLSMYNFNKDCMKNLHMLWSGVILSKRHVPDTEDTKLNKFEMIWNEIYNTYSRTVDILIDEFDLLENYSYGLAADVITQREVFACWNPQKCNTDVGTSPPTRILNQMHRAMLNSLQQSRRTSNNPVRFSDIFEYHRTCRRRKITYKTISYVTDDSLMYEFRLEHSKLASNSTYWYGLNMVINYFNTFKNSDIASLRNFFPDDILSDEDIDNILVTILSAEIEVGKTTEYNASERIAHFVNGALERYDKLINDYSKRRITNGKKEYISLPNHNRREGTSQNPVSVESF
tara:strand:- start:990 stop:2609 length:1620 start_codon:yes stop_codon:yes gene_type:complete